MEAFKLKAMWWETHFKYEYLAYAALVMNVILL